MVKLEKQAAKHRRNELRKHMDAARRVWVEFHHKPEVMDEGGFEFFHFEMCRGSEISTLSAVMGAW